MNNRHYSIDENVRSTPRILLWGIVAIFVGMGILVAVYFLQDESVAQPTASSGLRQQPEEVADKIEGRYLFHGTIFWGRGVAQAAARADSTIDYHQPFSGLGSFQPELYDAWVADLECPTSQKDIPFRTQVDQLVFNCHPDFLPEAAKYFQFLNLANNHSGDQGVAVFDETRTALTKNNIQHFGHPDASVSDNTCEVVSLPVRITTQSNKAGSIPVAFCAWHYFFRVPQSGEIEIMKKYAEVMPVFAFVHMGVEYAATASQSQRDIAHQIIDNGADFVIANNPHWVQDSEAYKGKLIVYSTGNFIFDQIDAETQRSVSIDVKLQLEDKRLDQWLAIGEKCKNFQDDCLDKIQKSGLAKLSPSYGFDAVAGVGGYMKITQRADESMQQAVKQRLHWLKTIEQLTVY